MFSAQLDRVGTEVENTKEALALFQTVQIALGSTNGGTQFLLEPSFLSSIVGILKTHPVRVKIQILFFPFRC
jgi:hypothetical protein